MMGFFKMLCPTVVHAVDVSGCSGIGSQQASGVSGKQFMGEVQAGPIAAKLARLAGASVSATYDAWVSVAIPSSASF